MAATEGLESAFAEHYMMLGKARLFGDQRKAAEIVSAHTPAHAMVLGREVDHFDQAVWEQYRWDIVVSGSLATFSSDPRLCEYLVATRQRAGRGLPVDRIWDIGLAADSNHATSPSLWRGLNLLGFALVEARERLQ